MASRREPLWLSVTDLRCICQCVCTPSPGSTWPSGLSSCTAHGSQGSTHLLQEEAWNKRKPRTSFATWMWTLIALQLPMGSNGLSFKLELELWRLAFVLVLQRRRAVRQESAFPSGCAAPELNLSFYTSNGPASLAFVATGRWASTSVYLVTSLSVFSLWVGFYFLLTDFSIWLGKWPQETQTYAFKKSYNGSCIHLQCITDPSPNKFL